MEERICERDEF